MKPASASDSQAVLDAVGAGDPVPEGFGFDGVTAYELDAADEDRIEEGGPVMPPDYEAPPAVPSAATTATTATTTTTTKP